MLVRHRTGGGVSLVQLMPDETESTLIDLAGAASVAVSPDGRWRAWPEGGATWLATMDAGSAPVRIGAGSLARFSPDASLLMLFDPESTDIVDLAGARIARVGPTACWLGDGRGCRP